MIKRLIRAWLVISNPRVKRFNEVRHMDENSAARRRAIMENRAEVLHILSRGRRP